jgi:hypothetical protein
MRARELLREELKNIKKGSRRWKVLDHEMEILRAESERLSNKIVDEMQVFRIIRREKKSFQTNISERRQKKVIDLHRELRARKLNVARLLESHGETIYNIVDNEF